MGNRWQSPCPTRVRGGRVVGGTLARLTEGKLRPETRVSGSHRQSRTRAPGSRPDRERTWDLVSPARWGRVKGDPLSRRRTLQAPIGAELSSWPLLFACRFLGSRGPISRVPGSTRPLPISTTTPLWLLLPPLGLHGSLSAQLCMPGSRARANGKP